MKNSEGKALRRWATITAVVLVLAVIVNILASTIFYDILCTVLGKSRTVLVPGGEGAAYTAAFSSKEEALANSFAVSRSICEEGFVLLKNQSGVLPLAQGASISVFGKNSVNPAYSGSGSSGSSADGASTLEESLTAAGFICNPALVEFYRDNARSGAGRDRNPTDLDSGNEVSLSEGETPIVSYTEDVWSSCDSYRDAALIVITRIGGEGFDMPRSADGTHSLQLSRNEQDLIAKVEGMDFGAVVVLLNVATTMELKDLAEDSGVDAILWMGFPGERGLDSLGELLRGETANGEKLSPSGKTVDTFAADFTHAPVWENFGAALGGDAYTIYSARAKGQLDTKAYFVDYEEGIYIGYRYYETAYAEAQAGNYDFIYEDEVVYPFGYGLSYTQFRWTPKNADEAEGFHWDAGSPLILQVEVENTGTWPGRDVVELYVTPPYTPGGIEKSSKVLVAFAKTEILQPGASQTVELTVTSPYAFASFDCYDKNGNGFAGYEAEAGNYVLSVSTDAHNAVFTVNTTLDSALRYETDPITGNTVAVLYTNQADPMQDADQQLGSVLSREDFAGTWPARRTEEEKSCDDNLDWMNAIVDDSANQNPNPNRPALADTMPTTGMDRGVSLSQLVDLPYNDSLWDDFIDQLTVDEMSRLINWGAFHTEAIERLGVPQTTSSDGSAGFANFMSSAVIYDTCLYPCETVAAATWNVERLRELGEAVGEEALVGDSVGDGSPYSGWYAPGLNLHRSPFGGRNFEYYSEDPVLSGCLAAALMEGTASRGVYNTMKHFALNDQETHRSVTGLVTWCTEQSMRELYLKAFELAIKTAKTDGVTRMGIMSSFNRIGKRWAGGDYRLLTTILRQEWGFEGLVISDFNTCPHMVVKDMVYAGGDLNLQTLGTRIWMPEAGNASDVTVARAAAKNILYVVANSNALRGNFIMAMPIWQMVMLGVDVALAAALALWGILTVHSTAKKRQTAS